ncbi:probable methyltransferase TARBP1 [Neocloeon triangulifer]|uniref:probable methyltransferase TARBP1 n=1 Tax=Neocloeon triangulifer TaxID=2078957 RepID=UPI00286FAEA8|nr:probable methyltransferase TARBP1 [Neocloeon triangulifer]
MEFAQELLPIEGKKQLANLLENTIASQLPLSFNENDQQVIHIHRLISARLACEIECTDVEIARQLETLISHTFTHLLDFSNRKCDVSLPILKDSLSLIPKENSSRLSQIFLNQVVKYVNGILEGGCLLQEESSSLMMPLNLLDCLLNFCPEENLSTKISTLALALIFSGCDRLSSFAISNLLPRVLNSNPQDVSEIWSTILTEENPKNMKLTPLCLLMEIFLSSTKLEPRFLHDDCFWLVVQKGLVSRDQMTRKQARYMLKRALHFFTIRKISAPCNRFEWDSSNQEIWTDFFLILESLEEKQVHIIKPVLPLLEKVFAEMCLEWAFVALQQVINHDNNHIIKWGLEFFFNHPWTSGSAEFFIEIVIPALDNTPLFHDSDLSDRLEDFVKKCASEGERVMFKSLLLAVRAISWGPVPLFLICKSLGNLPKLDAWDSEDLKLLKSFLVDAMSTQNVFLRAAAQSVLLRAAFSLVDASKVNQESWLDLLASFNRKESMARGLNDWQLTIEFVQKTAEVQFKSREFIFKSSAKAAARYLVILSDAGLLRQEEIDQLALEFKWRLTELETRAYYVSSGGPNAVDALLELLVHILDESGRQEKWEETILSKLVGPKSLEGLFGYLHRKLKGADVEDLSLIKIYINSLKIFEKPEVARLVDFKELIITANQIFETGEKSLEAKYFAAQVIQNSCQSPQIKRSNDIRELLIDSISKMTKLGTLNSVNHTDLPKSAEQRDQRNRTVSGILTANWSSLFALLETEETFRKSVAQETILDLAEDAVESSGPETLSQVMACLRYFLHREKEPARVENILERTYLKCFEHRKSELFWLSIKAFIKMAFNPCILERSDLNDCLLQLTEKLYQQSQIVAGLFNLVVDNFLQHDVAPCPTFCNQLGFALLFGPSLRKDQKILNSVCQIITSNGDEIPANKLVENNCDASQQVRAKAVQYLLTTNQDLAPVAAWLIEKDTELSRNKKLRYFADSHVHRTKHRIAQSLLLISCSSKNEPMQVKILQWATASLGNENHQPSVRYLIEWLASIILTRNEDVGDKFFKELQEASSRRLSSIPSFISILYLWTLALANDECRTSELIHVLHKIIEILLPWCMAQNYNIRLYAQVALLRIFALCEKRQLTDVLSFFSTLQSSVKSSIEQSSGVKNAIKLQEDFLFSVFDPVAHLSLETILVEFPRLTNVGQDEWLPDKFFKLDETKVAFKLINEDEDLKHAKVANWILKATGAIADIEDQEEHSYSIVQRKVTPWSDMFAESNTRETRTPNLGGLVIVASLVDKAPNLGGLSRTCEIFGASELIIGNLKIVDELAFQSLSVTAEKWINLSEVKPENLVSYLCLMKKQGYTLMAAEQTSKSVPLQSVKFDKKTLVLLGNEKEGIPAELLPYLDVCVEIPQMGVIRSLNVHVTGALFVWQYFQQHHLSSLGEE